MLTPIAIIGIGCRFPGADGPRAFWRLLSGGTDAITAVPDERRALGTFDDSALPQWGAFLNGIEQFDAPFFGVTADEARSMDPQQRLMLEVAWEAMEDAGVAPQMLAGSRTGVFAGVSSLNYGSIALQRADSIDRHTNSGAGGSVVPNRISYFFDLRGPSFAVDGACASSLLAVHLACQNLWGGDADIALAGGVNVMLLHGPSVGLARGGMLAPDGRCRPFDATAAGWARGEGAGVVLLKPLPRALEDGDPIYAVIRGTAVAQSGRSNGLTGPSRWAQEAVLRDAYRRAGVAPGQVDYVEAHSAGTLIGDATEWTALGAILGEERPAGHICRVGSVKSNLGHLEAAAGIAGLIKVALMLKHEQFAPTLHFEKLNPHVAKVPAPLQVPTEPAPWSGENGERIAGVSANGYAGVNVHAVLASAPRSSHGAAAAGPYLLALSARDAGGLRDLAGRYASWLDETPDANVGDLCHTANVGRALFPHRLAVIARDVGDLRERLVAFAAGKDGDGIRSGVVARGRSATSAGAVPVANGPDRVTRLDALARAYVTGADVDLAGANDGGRRVHGLPTYPFQRQPYWLERGAAPASQSDVIAAPAPAPSPEPKPTLSAKGRREAAATARPASLDPLMPPRNDIERRLVRVWEETLNIEPIGVRDSFFDLGGESATALHLFAAIEREFGPALPLASLFSSPTIEQLARLLAQGAAVPEAAARWDPVVTLNATGSRPPLFYLPGLGGHAFDLRALIQRLGADQPVHVLHPQGLDPRQVPMTRVEDMAAAFVPHMRAIQPRGPYRLGGYSFGGSVAFEIARQLRAAGERVSVLALLDAFAPDAFRKRALPKRLMTHLRTLWGLEGRRRDYVRQRVKRLWHRVRPAPGGRSHANGHAQAHHDHGHTHAHAAPQPSTVIDAVKRVADANRIAWQSYQPALYPGRVVLFRAHLNEASIRLFTAVELTNGWGRYAADGVDVIQLPCDHLDVFRGQSLDYLAERMRACLEDADPDRVRESFAA